MEALEPCEDCGAAAAEECAPYCVNNQPTDAELAQDWLDVGAF